MVAGATFYFNSKESTLRPVTFPLATGTGAITAAWTSVSPLGPQNVALVLLSSLYLAIDTNCDARCSKS